jgi:hypothetical protein
MIALFAAAALATQDPAATIAALENMYQQSCQVKAYGSYDDICNGLRKQMREAEKRLKKQAKELAKAAKEQPEKTAEAAPAQVTPALGFAPAKD